MRRLIQSLTFALSVVLLFGAGVLGYATATQPTTGRVWFLTCGFFAVGLVALRILASNHKGTYP